jgi:hypothetical protein
VRHRRCWLFFHNFRDWFFYNFRSWFFCNFRGRLFWGNFLRLLIHLKTPAHFNARND